MTSPAMLVLLIIGYIAVCVFLVFFCMIADPEDFEMAYFLQERLPSIMWKTAERFVGESHMDLLQAMLDRSFMFVYLFVVMGCWIIVFWLIYPWILVSDSVSIVHCYIGDIVFLACFGSWLLCHNCSPGLITAQTFKQFDHYPYDNLMFLQDRRCETTKLLKIPRSKFDRLKYNANVPRYDHFCGWVYNTIGEENYRWFLLFLVVHVGMCLYGSIICFLLFRSEIIEKKLMDLTFFDRATGETVMSDFTLVSQYLFATYTLEAAVFIVMFAMGLALLAFLSYHVYLTSYNQTTNENGKWADIRKWHKKEKGKYELAVKQGLVKAKIEENDEATVDTPAVSDGDVTCTGASSSKNTSQEEQEKKQPEYFDPGPFPKNLYDKGFFENWKEVLFPLSTRSNVLDYCVYSRPPQRSENKAGSKTPVKKTTSSRSDKKD